MPVLHGLVEARPRARPQRGLGWHPGAQVEAVLLQSYQPSARCGIADAELDAVLAALDAETLTEADAIAAIASISF